MPYKSLSDANPSIRGIRPRVTLAQANEIANIADTITKTNPDGAWPIAIATFKRVYRVRGGRWMKRIKKTSEVADEIYPQYGEGLRGRKPIVLPEIEIEEAATYKTRCQALIRDMAAILNDRTLPQPMRDALTHIQSELKRTWADLAAMGESMELEEIMKTVAGKTFPASDFLAVENPDEPSTWHLQASDHGKPDHRLMGAAWAALHGGYRGNKYEGPKKADAIRKLKAMYKAEDMTVPAEESAQENGYDSPMSAPMGATSFSDLDAAENAQDAAQEAQKRVFQFQTLINNIFSDEMITDKVGAVRKVADEFVTLIGELMGNPTEAAENAPRGAEGFAESESGAALSLVEEVANNEGVRAPVIVNFAMIKPGAGNKRDMHWYPADVLKRDAHVFENADIFATDHNDAERSERTKVGKVQAITGFTDDGAPIAKAVIFDPDMAEKTRNRAQANELATLECSILGQGRASKKKIGEETYNVVEAITKGIALELVSKAGAGGHALNIQESDKGGETVSEQTPPASATPAPPEQQPVVTTTPVTEAQPVALAESEVKRIVGETNLPEPAKARLTEKQYKDEKELREAVTAEIEYVKKLTNAGKPTNLGNSQPTERVMTEKELQEREKELLGRYGYVRG